MLYRALMITGVVCCALVAASFALFARDQLAGASKHQTTEIVGGLPTTPRPVPVVKAQAQPRRFIDGAASSLTTPFRAIVQSGDEWTKHIVPTLLALLVYGVGLGYVARFSRGLA